jgi:zinc D-Ala-D-Ala carboxypeptidase
MPRVSEHFTFAELTITEHRDFLDEQADAPPQVRANLVRLAVDLLEPVRALVGPLRVNSGYRCRGLNSAIGGSRTSAHVDGLAADVVPVDLDLRDAYVLLAESPLPFDQLIYEFGRWIHIGGARHGAAPRRECLAIYQAGGYVRWSRADPRFAPFDRYAVASAPLAPAAVPEGKVIA